MPEVSLTKKSNVQDVDALLSDYQWGNGFFGPLLHYSFPRRLGDWTGPYPDGSEPYDNRGTLSSMQQSVVDSILSSISKFADLTFWSAAVFNSPPEEAELRFGLTDGTETAHAYTPYDDELAGDVWFNRSSGEYDSPVRGSYAYYSFMHEIGHALGLKHPHETEVFGAMSAPHDNMNYTVMSYRSYAGMDLDLGYGNEEFGYAQTFMMYDIAALQHMYGADFGLNSSDSVYSWDPLTGKTLVNGTATITPGANRIFLTVWDGGGIDTYDLSNYAGGVSIDLNPGKWTTASIAQLADLGDGRRAEGNIANALLYKNNLSSLIENAKGGTGNDVLIGNQAANTLTGGGGDDVLTGGLGADILDGGLGADIFVYLAANHSTASATDRIRAFESGLDLIDLLALGSTTIGWTELTDPSDSTLYSLVTVTAGAATMKIRVDGHLTLLDFAEAGHALVGTAGDDTLTGGSGNDQLTGLDGNDLLIGGRGADVINGGAGADDMRGGQGNDIYAVDDAGDLVVELAGEGDDTLGASASYFLAAGMSIEAISTTSQSGTAAIAFWGNEFAQSIFGNEGNNQLLGLDGNDQLVGYGGNDVLVGGGGIDYLRGGLGNDVYGIGEGDIILETAGEGDDSLAADIGSYYLNDDASIETLSTANQAGTVAQNLTGNNFAQTVAGSEGANVLNGNLGNDLLRGYGGADIFFFDTTPGANNHDVIADLEVGVDKIALQNSIFTGLAEGNLGANQFVIGSAAQDADDRIIWNAATNQLLFDADGSGAGAAVLFAIVNDSPNLQASDFMIV